LDILVVDAKTNDSSCLYVGRSGTIKSHKTDLLVLYEVLLKSDHSKL